jgi:hypothetical protein
MSCRLSVLLFIVIFSALISCKNNDQLFKPVVYTYINIVNASADTLNFYLNGTRQNNSSSLYPGGQTFYLPVPAGLQNYQFKKAGNTSVLFSLPLTLQDSVNNSVYLTGETADKSFHTVDFLDNTGIDSGAFAKVRFVNASPDAGSLSLSLNDTLAFSSAAFETTSAFRLISSGQKLVKQYQSGSSLLKTDTVTFQPNHIYTIYSKGMLNGKGSAAFGLGVAINL